MDKLGTPKSNEWRTPSDTLHYRGTAVEIGSALSINNPCSHTGAESAVCEICDPRKMIATLKSTLQNQMQCVGELKHYNHNLKEKIEELDTEIASLKDQIENLTVCRDHWRTSYDALTHELDHVKSNHLDMVNRNAFLRQRPDLLADRIPAYLEFVKAQDRVKELEAENYDLTYYRACTENLESAREKRIKKLEYELDCAETVNGALRESQEHWYDQVEILKAENAKLIEGNRILMMKDD